MHLPSKQAGLTPVCEFDSRYPLQVLGEEMKGFTLVEALVAVTVISVIVGLIGVGLSFIAPQIVPAGLHFGRF